MKVLKFGGTSVGTTKSMLQVIAIIKKASEKELVVVVTSAFSGITNKLLLLSKKAKNNDYSKLLNEIKQIHFDRISDLKLDDKKAIEMIVTNQIKIIAALCKGIYLTKSIPHKTLAEIVSTGEILASIILAKAVKASHLDSRLLIKTHTTYNNASVDLKVTTTNIQKYFKDKVNNTTVVGGFIASNLANETTTLGRGGSDYSAAIYAAALEVDLLEIWTDVSGMFTANPKIVSTAFPIKQISYQEAMELSHFGAKVIYPPTILPVLEKNIPIKIKNTFNSNEHGTLISNQIVKRKCRITGITHIENIALITLEGNGMIGIPGFSKRLFDALYFERINVRLITQASSEHSICIAIDVAYVNKVAQIVNQAFEYEIITKKVLPLKVESNLSIVAVVGDQMKSHHGISGDLFSALGNHKINVRAIAQGASEKNISVVIETKDANKSLQALHHTFFDEQVKQLHLFITGVGNVGATLLQQIKDQRDYILKKLKVNIKIIGISNSTKMLFNENGIDLKTWKSALANGKQASFDAFYNKVKALHLPQSIFVDNTANTEITSYYPSYLKARIAIVTCNKVACSSSFKNYQSLQNLAIENKTSFLYETNVGAGLPIIETLNKLILTGDEIISIQAVLSGSLNYIFNNYNSNSSENSFYNIVIKAGENGFTEPDPRIDLSGIDVMRKILILVRESGVTMELTDIKNDSFLPKNAQNTKTSNEFMQVLKGETSFFNRIYNKAFKENKQLKFVASYTNGLAKVGLEEMDNEHPFYGLKGSDNMVLFYTKRYPKQPLIIKGAGAGAAVTAAGLFTDILRAVNKMS